MGTHHALVVHRHPRHFPHRPHQIRLRQRRRPDDRSHDHLRHGTHPQIRHRRRPRPPPPTPHGRRHHRHLAISPPPPPPKTRTRNVRRHLRPLFLPHERSQTPRLLPGRPVRENPHDLHHELHAPGNRRRDHRLLHQPPHQRPDFCQHSLCDHLRP